MSERCVRIYDIEEKRFIFDESLLMELADLDLYMKFEAVGVQDDGQPVVFDKCGNFGYLDPDRYKAVVIL